MRIRNEGFHPTLVRWIPFFAGFAVGLLFVILFAGQFMSEQNIWGIGSLSEIRYLSVKKDGLFLYALKIRWRTVLIMFFLSVTILGRLFRIACTAWYGFGLGTMLMAACMAYRTKGILLMLSGLFPHMICYVPAYILLCNISMQLHDGVYRQAAEVSIKDISTKLLVLAVTVMAGCLLEGYVNPIIMTKVLKFF